IVSRSLNVPFCLAFHYYLHNLILHSFPTRRSSDLDIQFLSALLFKDAYKNINNFVYGAVNLSKQDITEAKLLYQLFTIESRVERSEEHTSELQSRFDLVCRLLLEKKKKISVYILQY